MKNFSTEITAILVMVLTQVLSMWFTEGTAAEVATVVASLLAAGYLWLKRYARGDITPLGFRK